MSNDTNSYSRIRIEYHILQSFPVTCLNRDDVGSPKTAVIGGTTRARVSSQCWKRQVRMALAELGIHLGVRTKKLKELFSQACVATGADPAAADACGEKMAGFIGNDALAFISTTESQAFAAYAKEQGFDAAKLKDKDMMKAAKKIITPGLDALDIALFGRMAAKVTELQVEAAASFAHAISTHTVSNEIEFFTALDDLQDSEEKQGSAHMGNLEFNSATYYRYISLDLGQLAQTLDAEELKQAIAAFTKALYLAVPSARQTTMAGACSWDFAKVLVRKGQRLQLSFDTAVKRASSDGFLEPSIKVLCDELTKKEQLSGSLFGKIAEYEWGKEHTFSIDHLVSALQSHVAV